MLCPGIVSDLAMPLNVQDLMRKPCRCTQLMKVSISQLELYQVLHWSPSKADTAACLEYGILLNSHRAVCISHYA